MLALSVASVLFSGVHYGYLESQHLTFSAMNSVNICLRYQIRQLVNSFEISITLFA